MAAIIDQSQLPTNFPQTFLPDRQLLARLLAFAAKGGGGDKIKIGEETGIPTGKDTGKVEPMIHYTRGMGLVKARKTNNTWELTLTELGEIVFTEDRFLSESVTLWLLHLLLCRRRDATEPPAGIAPAWFTLFAESQFRLGQDFRLEEFTQVLNERYGTAGYIGPLASLVLRTYLEKNCFGMLKIMTTKTSSHGNTTYHRHSAPSDFSIFPAYSIFLFIAWDVLFPERSQIQIDILFKASRILHVLGWDMATASTWLEWMVDNGLLQLDRHTGHAVALRLQHSTTVLRGLYDELL